VRRRVERVVSGIRAGTFGNGFNAHHPDEDSGEAERLFRREAERHSGMIPNTIRERSDAGFSIVIESVRLRQGKSCPERSEG
jgi:hypothetical protein